MDKEENNVEDSNRSKITDPGFKLTIGRFSDIVVIGLNAVIILFSFISFVSIAITIAISNSAANDIGKPSKDSCLLFAQPNTDDGLIEFAASGTCYYILVSPPIIWLFSGCFIFFLILKAWRAWNLSCIEVFLFFGVLTQFLYTMAVAITLSIGKEVTCSSVARISTPDKVQSCAILGGAFYRINSDTTREFIRFVSYLEVTEVTLWITCLIILLLGIYHLIRIIVWGVRLRRRVIRKKSTIKEKIKEPNSESSPLK